MPSKSLPRQQSINSRTKNPEVIGIGSFGLKFLPESEVQSSTARALLQDYVVLSCKVPC